MIVAADLIGYYIAVGFGSYVTAAVINRQFYKNAKWQAIFRGVLIGIFLWPLAWLILFWSSQDGNSYGE